MAGVVIQLELNEDNDIFGNGAEGTDQPGEVGHYVFAFCRVAEDAETIGKVSHQ